MSPLFAQTTDSLPALPAWPDQVSVYSPTPVRDGSEIRAEQISKPPLEINRRLTQTSTLANDAAPRPSAAELDARRLGPPSSQSAPHRATRDRSATAPSLVPEFGLPLDSIYTTTTALAVVVGLFLLFTWTVRRGVRKSSVALPDGVVRVLGRVPLAARQFAELLHVGNKLVLLSVTPAGVEPLTEITDPAEIDRLLGLCQQRAANSSTAEFDQVFRQLAREPAPDGFLGQETTRLAARSATDTYAAYRGGPGHHD